MQERLADDRSARAGNLVLSGLPERGPAVLEGLVVRMADETDAASIGRLHLASYRAAYRDLLPAQALPAPRSRGRCCQTRNAVSCAQWRTTTVGGDPGQGASQLVLAARPAGIPRLSSEVGLNQRLGSAQPPNRPERLNRPPPVLVIGSELGNQRRDVE